MRLVRDGTHKFAIDQDINLADEVVNEIRLIIDCGFDYFIYFILFITLT